MPEVRFTDSYGEESVVSVPPGMTLRAALLSADLPPAAVVAERNGRPVPPSVELHSGDQIRARLVEGYGITAVRELYGGDPDPDCVHEAEHLSFADGLSMQRWPLGPDEVTDYVEQTIRETVEEYDLVAPDETVVVGLSGGIDSEVTVAGLAAVRDAVGCEVHAVTVTEPWAGEDPRESAAEVAERAGISYHGVGLESIERRFGLTTDAEAAFETLIAERPDAAIGVADHVTTAHLEAVATDLGATTICLGSNASDILAGLLGAESMGLRTGAVPSRSLGSYTYVYPMCFLTRKEVCLYHAAAGGWDESLPQPEPRDLHPPDTNFFYHLAAIVQSTWPGAAYWWIENATGTDRDERSYRCSSCGKTKPGTPDAPGSGLCSVCTLLRDLSLAS